MGLLKTLRNTLFPPRPAARYHTFQVKCSRCGEILPGRLDLYNDPSLEFEEQNTFYFCRKVLMGAGPCYQQVEVTFKLNEARGIEERRAAGGEFVG